MQESKTSTIDLEKIFTRQDYRDFTNAINVREHYAFFYGKQGTYQVHPNTKTSISISGRSCYNGVWKDNYLYSIGGSYGHGGFSSPFDPVNGILSYESIINMLYKNLDLTPITKKQLSIFDFEM